VVIVTTVRSPPGPFYFVCVTLGIIKFFSALARIPLRCGRVEFLRGGDVNRTPKVGRSLPGHKLGGSVSALPVYGLF
jgi:hypothetical protein